MPKHTGRNRQQRRRQADEGVDAGTLHDLLMHNAAALPFTVDAAAADRLVQFIQLLNKWNAAYNLTSVRDMKSMVTRHIMDSLVILPYLHGHRVLDVGSGAGLPGIPLALLNPDRQFTLLDSNSKKTRFMQQAVNELGLDNVTVVTDRIEQFAGQRLFDTIVARAFSSIDKLLTGVQQLLTADSIVLAMKGIYPLAELEAVPAGFHVERIEPLQVPGLDAERHVAVIRPSATPGVRHTDSYQV